MAKTKIETFVSDDDMFHDGTFDKLINKIINSNEEKGYYFTTIETTINSSRNEFDSYNKIKNTYYTYNYVLIFKKVTKMQHKQ